MYFQDMNRVDFINALFKSWVTFADQHLLLVELSFYERDGNNFISRGVVCRSSDGSYNSTDSSLVTVGYQLHFMILLSLCALHLLIWHACGTII